jgi:hypothetical protein
MLPKAFSLSKISREPRLRRQPGVAYRGIDKQSRWTRIAVVVTNHGEPDADIHPYSARRPSTLTDLQHSQLKIRGDIVSPLNVSWKALEQSRVMPTRHDD